MESLGSVVRVLVQRLILASFAAAAGKKEPLGDALAAIAAERERDPAAFDARAREAHEDLMPSLAGLSGDDGTGVPASQRRGPAVRAYLEALDAIGVPGERSLAWVACLLA